MKLLLTSDWFTPAVNGVVTSVLNLRNGLENRGHEVHILTLSRSTCPYVRDRVYILPALHGYGSGISQSAAGAPAKKLLKNLLTWGRISSAPTVNSAFPRRLEAVGQSLEAIYQKEF